MKKDTPYLIISLILALTAGVIIFVLSAFPSERPLTDVPLVSDKITGEGTILPQPDSSEGGCFDKNVMIPENITFDSSDKYTTPFGTFEPIGRILELNAYMTCNPTVLTEEQSLCYIVPDLNKEKAEEIMAQMQEISDGICEGISSDEEKVRAIAMWTGGNIAYDMDAAHTCVDLSVISLEAILDNGMKTTCAGFANFFSALCHCQGIYVLNLKGGSASDGWVRSKLEDAPANHCWNAVLIDNKWYYSDPTWISDLAVENGEYTGGSSILPYYALFGFEEMSIEHRIDISEHVCYNI
ncbi:MAG: transglutaminase domain-containing protein [Huintestinicola sp.]